jgi:hypothetical protein
VSNCKLVGCIDILACSIHIYIGFVSVFFGFMISVLFLAVFVVWFLVRVRRLRLMLFSLALAWASVAILGYYYYYYYY